MRDLSLLPDLELALIQTTLAWQDPAANRAHFASLLEQARGADLIVLPEMFSTGFSMDSAALAEPEECIRVKTRIKLRIKSRLEYYI